MLELSDWRLTFKIYLKVLGFDAMTRRIIALQVTGQIGEKTS